MFGSRAAKKQAIVRVAEPSELYKELFDINYKLDPNSPESAEFIQKCVELCHLYNLSSEQFALKFDAYRFANKLMSKSYRCTLEELSKVGDMIREGIEKEKRTAMKSSSIRVKADPSVSTLSAATPSFSQQMDYNKFQKKFIQSQNINSTDELLDELVNGDDKREALLKKRKAVDSQFDEQQSFEDLTASADSDHALTPSKATPPNSGVGLSGFTLSSPTFSTSDYATRNNAGQLMCSYNGDILATLQAPGELSLEQLQDMKSRVIEVEVLAHDDDQEEVEVITKSEYSRAKQKNNTHAFRFMYQNEEEIRGTLESRLINLTQYMMEQPEFTALRAGKEGVESALSTSVQQTSSNVASTSSASAAADTITVKKEGEQNADIVKVKVEDNDVVMSGTEENKESEQKQSEPFTTGNDESKEEKKDESKKPIRVKLEVDGDDNSDEIPIVGVKTRGQHSAIVCGRIVYDCSDTDQLNDQQKLTSALSVWLEGDMDKSQGERIQMRLNMLKSYAFFPGQIVIAKGLNVTGMSLIVEDYLSNAALPRHQLRSDQITKLNKSLGYRPLGVMTACGPFTTHSDLTYQPLFDLLREALTLQVDVLVLVGPFLDVEHPLLSANVTNLAATYQTLFDQLIQDIMKRVEGSKMKVVITPSTRDVHHIPVYPQPPFPVPASVASDVQSGRLLFTSNPATVRINDVTIGITSQDIIAHLANNNEVSKTSNGLGRLQRLASHLIAQQSYYPLFPAPDTVSLDLSHHSLLSMPCTPDLLVLPSMFKYFANELTPNSCIAINPQQLTKGNGGGFYALTTIYPFNDDELQNISQQKYMNQRTRVDIFRI